jgi:hypothetical protein
MTLQPLDPRSQELYQDGRRQLEADFDPERDMVILRTGMGDYHDPRGSLAYAACLLRDGGQQEVPLAERIIGAVLSMQERRPDNAHFGNFRWFWEDEGVTDLNAVEFMLEALIDVRLRFGQRLSPGLRRRIREAVRLGLGEIERLGVHLSYTNICLLDILNTVLGAQLIGDAHYLERGKQKLDAWIAYTARSGAPHEFNSPTYCAVDINALAALAERASDRGVALKARLMEERLWLHVATHFHRPTCQISGPHCRAYRHDTVGAGGYLKAVLYKELGIPELRRPTPYYPWPGEEGHVGIALGRYHLPDYLRPLFEEKPAEWEVRETADAELGLDMTSYLTPDCCLGTASTSYAVGEPPEPWPQFNAGILYYRRDREPGYGLLYTRYTVNEYDSRHMADEEGRIRYDLWDLGQFRGVQHNQRAIWVYGLPAMPITASVHTLKLDVMLLDPDEGTEVWVGRRRFQGREQRVAPGEPVVIADGRVYVALIPLEPTNMGQEAPIVLERRPGELVLSIHNYLGPSKNFWEYRTLSGPFYHGNVRSGVVVEVASRSEFRSAAEFRQYVSRARVTDVVSGDGVRDVSYASDGGSLGLRYSLHDLGVLERRIDGRRCTAPMLEAPCVRQGRGPIAVGGATVTAGGAPAWLLADSGRRLWVSANPSNESVPLRFETPEGALETDAFGFGRIVWRGAEGRVEVDTASLVSPLRLSGPRGLKLRLNGRDVTRRLGSGRGSWRVLELG